MEKKNVHNLFVASIVYEALEETEMWSQYESMGNILHHVIVTPQKKLVYSMVDENGVTKYYDYEDDKEIAIYDKRSSYNTESNIWFSIRGGAFAGGTIPPIGVLEEAYKQRKGEGKFKYAYLMPFKDYLKSRLGKDFNITNPRICEILVTLLPKHMPFELSQDPKEAEEQLNAVIYQTVPENEMTDSYTRR